MSKTTSWLTPNTAVRPNGQLANLTPKKALRSQRLRHAYNFITDNARRGIDTPTREIGTKTCRTLRRAGLVVWSDNSFEKVVVIWATKNTLAATATGYRLKSKPCSPVAVATQIVRCASIATRQFTGEANTGN